MTIYDIMADFYALKNLVEGQMTNEDGETRELTEQEKADFNAWLDENEANLETKMNNIYKVYTNLKARAEVAEAERKALKDEMERLSRRAKIAENEANRVKGLFAYALDKLKQKNFKTALFSVGWRKTAESAKEAIDFNIENLPIEFVKKEFSSSLIKKAIEDGKLYRLEDELGLNRNKLFYRENGEDKELKGVIYCAGETLTVR